MDMYPFPAGLTYEASAEVEGIMTQAIRLVEQKIKEIKLVGLDEEGKYALFQDGIIPYSMMHNRIHSSIIKTGSSLFYRLNNEDHLEIVNTSLMEDPLLLWDAVLAKEEILAKTLNFAFDVKLGYLTSRITEVGTGLRVKVLLHLPGIVRTGYIKKLTQAVHQVGFSLKEYTRQGHLFKKEFYELSNSLTIGKTEIELIEGIKELVERIEKKEMDALETLQSAQDKVLEDELYRAYGTLQYARLLSYEEGIELLSKVRLGINFGYFEGISMGQVDALLFSIYPKEETYKKVQVGKKEEMQRAEYIRAHLYGHQ